MYELLWQKRGNRMPVRGAKTFLFRRRRGPPDGLFAAGAIRVDADLVARRNEVRKRL
jgi:hypothetical protein